MIRIVATADNHLGRNYARMSQAALATRRKYLRRAFGQVCDYATAERADVVVIAGDLFDTPVPRNVDRTQVARRLSRLKEAGIRVFAIAGNHDSPRSRTEEGGRTPLEVYEAAGLLTFFRELEGDEPVLPTEIINVRGQTLAMGGFSPNFAEGDDPLAAVAGLPQADLRVLVGHFLIEGLIHPGAGEAVARRASLEALRGVDVVIAGDIHDYHVDQIGGVRVVVPGSSEHMDFGSQGASPGFAEIVFDDLGRLSVRHRPLTPQPRHVIELGPPDLGTHDPSTRVVQLVEAALTGLGPDALVQVSFTGVVEPEVYGALSFMEVAERLRGQLCHLEWNATGLRPRRAAGTPGEPGLRRTLADDVRAAVVALAQEAGAEDLALLPEVGRELLAVIEGRDAA